MQMPNMEVEVNRNGGGGWIGLTTPTPVNLEDIVKWLEKILTWVRIYPTIARPINPSD